jgi:hypothetical protein
MTQGDRILEHLQDGGTLTALGALERFGCLRLAARIADLRAAGHSIKTTTVRDRINGKSYALYYVPIEAEQRALWGDR